MDENVCIIVNVLDLNLQVQCLSATLRVTAAASLPELSESSVFCSGRQV